jgi:hypothetical protein
VTTVETQVGHDRDDVTEVNMHKIIARYLGGHPAAINPARKVVLHLTEQALTCERPAFSIATASILMTQAVFQTEAAVNYKVSPFTGLFGGLKAQGEDSASAMMRQEDRLVVVRYRVDDGLEHYVRLTRVRLEGRSRAEVKADMAAGDWNGAQRLADLLMSWRST